jgi:hypothetical protein
VKNSNNLTKKIRNTVSTYVNVLLLSIFTIFMIANSSMVFDFVAFAQSINNTSHQEPSVATTISNQTQSIGLTAESIYRSQSMTIPSSVRTFVWYIVNEAHENSVNERHKYVSDHNPIYIPSNLIIPQGTALTFLDADAPWDTPHPHTINVMDSTGKIVYTTGKMDYTNTSIPKVLPVGKYSVMDTKYTWMKGNLTVSPNQRSTGTLIMGGFYTPTNQVTNNKDNDGGTHPGWLGYYNEQFPKNGFKILNTFNFHYATCKYCPGGFWPDQKTGDHTLIIYSTNQPLEQALDKLGKLVWENVYI